MGPGMILVLFDEEAIEVRTAGVLLQIMIAILKRKL